MMTDEVNPAAIVAWLRLARVYDRIQRASQRHLRRYDLTLAQFDVLAQVAAHPGLSQGELATRLFVTKGNVAGLIDRLERNGLIRRVSEPADRRRHCLHLTDAGRNLARLVVPAQEALITRLLAPLSSTDRQTLRRLLRTLDRSLKRAGI